MKKARVGIAGDEIVVREIETQKELASMKWPQLKDGNDLFVAMKKWFRETEAKKNCVITNIDWDNTTGKGWIAL